MNNSYIHISGLYDDAFVQKITTSGIPIWTKTYGGGNSILKTDDLISIDTQGLVIAGTFKNTCNFDPNGGSELVSSITQINTTSDGYILFLSSNGEFEWVRRLGGSEAGHALLDLSRDGNESLYLSGLFIGTTYFNDISYGDSISSVSLQAGCGFTFKLGETLWASSVENSSEYSLFPNPANEWIEIENLETPKEYVLTNSLGEIILSGTLNNGQQIDVSPLPKGMYFVGILQSENMTMLPLIVN